MKHITTFLIAIALCLSITGCSEQLASSKTINLTNLDAWNFFSQEPDNKISDVWQINDNVLVCAGTPLGYIYTKDSYTDFTLKLQWRWPEGKEPGKGGVLIRTTGNNIIWPKSLEAQINAGSAGDFWGLDGYSLASPTEETTPIENEKFGTLTNVKKKASMEKPAGQWNSYEIIANGQTVTLIINGKKVNTAIQCDLDAGTICLTSEGNEIHFKNIELTVIESE